MPFCHKDPYNILNQDIQFFLYHVDLVDICNPAYYDSAGRPCIPAIPLTGRVFVAKVPLLYVQGDY